MVAGAKRLSMLGAHSHALARFRGGDSFRAESWTKQMRGADGSSDGGANDNRGQPKIDARSG